MHTLIYFFVLCVESLFPERWVFRCFKDNRLLLLLAGSALSPDFSD